MLILVRNTVMVQQTTSAGYSSRQGTAHDAQRSRDRPEHLMEKPGYALHLTAGH